MHICEEEKSRPQSELSNNLITLQFCLSQVANEFPTECLKFPELSQFQKMKKFCGTIFALLKNMLQYSENILIGYSLFCVNLVRINLSKVGIIFLFSVCPKVQSKCFQM